MRLCPMRCRLRPQSLSRIEHLSEISLHSRQLIAPVQVRRQLLGALEEGVYVSAVGHFFSLKI